MDKIIYRIHKTVSSKNGQILLMVNSDHGMRDSGGHGGSTYSETSTLYMCVDYFARIHVADNEKI